MSRRKRQRNGSGQNDSGRQDAAANAVIHANLQDLWARDEPRF
jgi:hypothetical protein